VSLRALIAKKCPAAVATATPATPATDQGEEGQSVATVATVAVAKSESPKPAPGIDDRRELAEERAAIIEFEGGLPRAAAERLAGFVRCVDCDHWRPSGVQQHGDCAAHAGGTAGLWGTDARGCAAFQARELAEAVRAMARRWGYAADELAEALARAATDPEDWRRLTAADLATRRWPGGDGWQ